MEGDGWMPQHDDAVAIPIALCAQKTVTGFEWFLRVGTEIRVPNPGVFTDEDMKPDQVLPQVLRQAMAEEGFPRG